MKKLMMASFPLFLVTVSISVAETVPAGSHTARPAITEQIDDTRVVTLAGNVRRDLTPDRDLGQVEDDLQMRLYLVLQRSPAQQAALDNLIERQQQPTAPEYHQWITPQQFGERFGVSEQDIAKISQWLESHGMHVHGVMNNASFIDFSSTAGNVRSTFGTQLHYFSVEGGKHPALIQDPMIPAALANVVAGIQGLNKIPAHPLHTKTGQASWDAAKHRWQSTEAARNPGTKPLYANPNINNEFDVTPQDFYTIYNVNPVFNGGTKGASATVAVVEETDIVYGTVNPTTGVATGGDVANFRTLFGVPGTLNMHVYHGYGTVTCNDPGIDPNDNGEQGEAALDAEWANALAPAANLIFMSCDQNVNNGIISSEAALIDNNLADVMSLSYGHSELTFASTDFTAQDSLFAQAAAQGQSFIISTGDAGSDAADQNTTGTATSGFNVSAFSASPLVTAAGGTDFVDFVDQLEGGSNQSTYWGANSANYSDALGYIPETAWNSSCADSILAVYEGFTGAGYCDQPGALGTTASVVGGTGGFSTHYAVPAYQSGITGYSGTKRAQPDISSFAASGFYGHQLIYCDSHVAAQACDSTTDFATSGGTSFVAPQFAGVFTLLVNYTGTRQGLLNPALYALAKAQFTASATKSSCYSNGTTANAGVVTAGLPASTCTFNDVTSGNNDVPCVAGSTDCFVNTGASLGMLSLTGSTSLSVAYPSTPGYDEVAGIGTLNVNNLLTNWNKAFTSTAKVAASPTSISSTESTTLTATVTGATPAGFSGQAPAISGTATFKAGTTTLGSCTLSSGICTLAVKGTSLATGSNSITATFSGSKTYPASTSSAITVTETGGTGSNITLSTTSMAFGNQVVNTTSASQVVTITNNGVSAVSISSILITGTNVSMFSFINGCGASLAASANCSVSVNFEPSSTGAKSAALTITDSDPGSPQTVTLTGTGTAAGSGTVSLSATALAFGNVAVGATSASQSVTMTNTGATTVSISSIAVTGANASAFVFANSCGTSLAAGANCTIHGHFGPVTAGAMTAAITITDNATGSPQTVSLTGTGGSGGGGAVSLSATSLAFGNVPVGTTSASQSVTMTNTGATAVSISSIAITGANASAFGFANSCGTALAAGANCTIHGHFAPATAGAMTAAITITDNATGSPQTVSLTGTGGSGASPLTVSPASLSFGSINVSSISPGQIATISNTSASAVTITGFSFTGANASQFGILSNCTTNLPANSSCTAMISLLPTSTGALSAAFSVTSSGGNGSVALTGTGIATAALSFSTTTLTFPTTAHGTQSLASIITVTNSGTTTANFGFLGIGGTNPAEFYEFNSCGTSLAAGATCKFYVIFRPAAAASYTATLELFDNAQSGYQGVTLNGTGN